MAMLFIVPVLAFFGSISGVFGQFVCPTGQTTAVGTPKCKSATSSSCDKDECCTKDASPPACADTKPTGSPSIVEKAALRKTRCTATKMYSISKQWEKQVNKMSGTEDAAYVAACCVDCTAATCADWLNADGSYGCAAGTVLKADLSSSGVSPTLASTSACGAPTGDEYKSTCCAISCDSIAGDLAAKNAICGFSSSESNYFPKVLGTGIKSPVVASASDNDFKSTCCTACTSISCANVAASFSSLSCTSPAFLQSSKMMTPALTNCAAPSAEDFRAACCLNKCGEGDATAIKTRCTVDKRLDQSKTSTYPADATDGKFITDCCKDCSTEICRYWTKVSCATGQNWDNNQVLSGGTDCAEPTAEAKKATCCVTPMLCSAWVADASAALPTCFPFIGTLLASLAVVLGVDCL